MRATDVLIITTELTQEDFSGARANRLRSRLQSSIEFAKNLDLNPIIVIGNAGDDVLRLCPELEDCDFAFDPNFQGSIFSSIQAGIHGAKGATFVLPIGIDAAPVSVWKEMDEAAFSLKPDQTYHVVKFLTHPNGDTHPLYPQLVTRQGLPVLKALPSQTDWDSDSRILVRVLSRRDAGPNVSNPA